MRVNLAKDPSLRSKSTSAYLPEGGATLAYTEERAFYGLGSLEVTKSAENASGFRIANPIDIVAGLNYAISLYLTLPLEIPAEEEAQLLLQAEWVNSLGAQISVSTSTTLIMDNPRSWYRLSGVWTAPVGATQLIIHVIQPTPGSAGARFIFDALLVEQAEYVGGYVDNISVAEKYHLANKALSAVPQVVNGLRLGADIMLNNHVFNTIDEFGTIWVVTDLDGWWGQSDPEVPNIARGTEDGSYDVEGRLQARSMTLSGFFIPADAEDSLNRSIDRLVSAINLVRQPGWLIANERPTKAALVRLVNKPTIRTINARGRTSFQITLRAGDPIKYHWNDGDPDGFTSASFAAADSVVEVGNIGTADVSGVFTFTGPAGAGTRIYNASTDETMTLKEPLRGAGLVANVETVYATDGVATIRTTAPHGLLVGDEISLLNMVIPFSETDKTRIVTQVSTVFPYTFSFEISTDDIDEMGSNGQVYLVNNDTLEVDTYNHIVYYNGSSDGYRHKLVTLTDWIHFSPGNNLVEVFDNITQSDVVSKQLTSNVVTLETAEAHYLIPGESIHVELPTVVELSKKQLAGNTVTLTTVEPHGFSVGDTIRVDTTQESKIVSKSRSSNTVTLTTEQPHGVSVSDQVTVALPISADPIEKSVASNVVTLKTGVAHGFSVGDSITVALPTTASIVGKSIASGQAILTTSGAHNFSVGDSITVALPTSGIVVTKSRSGTLAVIGTSVAHGFSVGDVVVIALPTTATLTGARSITASTGDVLFTTTAPHNFSVGDRIDITTSGSTTATVTNRSATTSAATITTSAAHGFSVGERVTVSGVSSRYDGTFTITAVTATTFTYAFTGSAESATSSTGTVSNLTLIQDYNGTHYIDSIPSATTFTFKSWQQTADTSRSGATGSVINRTNEGYNGTKTLASVSATTFSYTY